MVSVQLDEFDWNKLDTKQVTYILDQNNMSNLFEYVYDIISKKHHHVYYLGNDERIKQKIKQNNSFDLKHFKYQLSGFYEQLRNTETNSSNLIVISCSPKIWTELSSFPAIYDMIQTRAKYNLSFLFLCDTFLKKFDLVRKQIDHCFFGTIIQEQELLKFVEPLFDPPHLYLQIHKTVYQQNNQIAIVWNSKSNHLNDRLFWYEYQEKQHAPATPQFSRTPSFNDIPQQHIEPPRPTLSPQNAAQFNPLTVQNTPNIIPSIQNDIFTKIKKKFNMVEELMSDIKELINQHQQRPS